MSETPQGRTVDGHGEVLDLEIEFYCSNCSYFRNVRKSDPDILCDSCDFVIATFRSREVVRDALRAEVDLAQNRRRAALITIDRLAADHGVTLPAPDEEPYPCNRIALLVRAIACRAERTETALRELRELIWLFHGHRALYGDDGEMQCSEQRGCDFKRATLDEIRDHLDPAGAALRAALRAVPERRL